MFYPNQVFPGIYHITDAMGVSFTLIEGAEQAILFDTGYGAEDVGAYVRTLTGKPVTVYLSHGHHDHMLGARWFDRTYLCKEDMEEFIERTGHYQRTKVARQAAECGVKLPDDFMDAVIKMPESFRFSGDAGGFESLEQDLGGLQIRTVHVPGHTPGSIVIHVPKYGLILTGDNWNPCTWMWFPTSARAERWRDSMCSLIRSAEEESGTEIRTVLCSHQRAPREGTEMKAFLSYMTDERIRQAPAVDMGAPINTHQIVKDEWALIFDADKQ